MYLNYYNLKAKPFQISTDPRFLWLGEQHKEALAVLRYGILDNKGFLLLTGEVGTGKTTLIHALINALGEEVIIANVPDPGLEIPDFFAYIARAFNLNGEFDGKFAFLSRFETFLNRVHDEGKKVLLIIDESQRMSQQLLEEIRLLSNIEKQSTKLINIFFVGQGEFNNIILEERNSALRQRITVNYDLGPLAEKEAGRYVLHRLKVAGSNETVFKPRALKEIYKFSRGYPRLINVICDRALITGYASESATIGSAIIKECAGEMKLRRKAAKKTSPAGQGREKTAAAASVESAKPRTAPKKIFYLLGALIGVWICIAAYLYAPETIRKFTAKPAKTEKPAGPASETPEAHTMEDSRSGAAVDSGNASAGAEGDKVEKPGEQLSQAPEAQSRPPEKFQIVMDRDIVLHIALNQQNEVSSEGFETLEKLAAVMVNDQSLEVIVKGYSKSLGSYQYIRKMSKFSANIVKGYLVGKGVQPGRIDTVGMVLLNSEEGSETKQGETESRWVEIQFK